VFRYPLAARRSPELAPETTPEGVSSSTGPPTPAMMPPPTATSAREGEAWKIASEPFYLPLTAALLHNSETAVDW